MPNLAVSGAHLSAIARNVELAINELYFVSTDASGCGSSRVASNVASIETWYGVQAAIAAEDIDACARGLDASVMAFTQADRALTSNLTPKAV